MSTKTLYTLPEAMIDVRSHYCPGCTHGVIHKFIAEIIDEFQIQKKTVLIAPVGCSVLLYDYMNCDSVEAAHGRAPAIATGIKRVKPDHVVISYQGDGDLLAIGMAETIHAANRGENITVIFVNNAVYGMTGGQMAPTTLIGQKTATSPNGRASNGDGFPIKACELLNTLEAPYFIARCEASEAKAIIKTKKVVKKAIQYQMEGRGYSFVEIVSNCNTGWGMTPRESNEWIRNELVKVYPVNIFRDRGAEVGAEV